MTPSAPDVGVLRYVIGVLFATIVFGACFYGLVLYEFNLDDLKNGALISLMTLAAQFVFGEALASSVARRSNQSFQMGKDTVGTDTAAPSPSGDVVEPDRNAPNG